MLFRSRVQDRAKVPHDDFAVTLKFGLTEAVYEWAKGMVSPVLPLWSYSVSFWSGMS